MNSMTICQTRIIHKSLIGNDLSDTNHFGGLKDSVHKQASVAKRTSESTPVNPTEISYVS